MLNSELCRILNLCEQRYSRAQLNAVVGDVLLFNWFYLHVQRFTTVYSLWFQKAAKGSKPQKLNLAALSGNEGEVKRLLSKGVGKCKIAFC